MAQRFSQALNAEASRAVGGIGYRNEERKKAGVSDTPDFIRTEKLPDVESTLDDPEEEKEDNNDNNNNNNNNNPNNENK